MFLDGDSRGFYQPAGRLLAFGQAGNDELKTDGDIGNDAWLYGDDGDDRLKGGAGNDVLFGGLGNDVLVGKRGRDLLVGGRGADRIVGNAGDDILIAAATTLDYDDAYPVFDSSTDTALANRHVLRRDHERSVAAIMQQWTSDNSYENRVAHVREGGGSLAGTGIQLDGNIVDDGERDLLTGASGDDLFFGNSDDDKLTDLKDEAFADILDWMGE